MGTPLHMQYAVSYTDSTVRAVCYQLCILCIQYRPSHLLIFYCVTILQWTNTVQSYLQLELWSSTFCASLHSATLTTSMPCYNALVFINQFYTTEYANLPTAKRHLSTFSSYSKSVHWQYYRWKNTRCLIPTCVQLKMKLKQDATSELGRQLYKKISLHLWSTYSNCSWHYEQKAPAMFQKSQ
jgi:hypothetical protein